MHIAVNINQDINTCVMIIKQSTMIMNMQVLGVWNLALLLWHIIYFTVKEGSTVAVTKNWMSGN